MSINAIEVINDQTSRPRDSAQDMKVRPDIKIKPRDKGQEEQEDYK